MKKKLLLISVFSVLATVPLLAQPPTTTTAELKIIELQTASLDSASDEFVEIFNASTKALEVEGWTLQYKSATGSEWSTKATLTGEIPGRHRFLLATDNYESSQAIKSGFAAGGGHVRIADNSLQTVDLIAWGSAAQPDGLAAPAPDKSSSLKRVVDEDGYFVDSDDNFADFIVSTTPTPQFDEIIQQTEEPDSAQGSNESAAASNPAQEAQAAKTQSFPPITITELFIDPAKPLTDADDEFVELFNPSPQTVSLEGYRIVTGLTGNYSYTLPTVEIQPGQYLPLFAIDTGLTLSNSGGKAVLLAPDDTELFETAVYEKAKSGYSWNEVSGQWVWALPSPGFKAEVSQEEVAAQLADRSNMIVAAVEELESTGGSASKEAEERNVYQEPVLQSSSQINNAVLAGVGLLAVLYAGYEYRHDIGNRINQLREYIRHRRENRASS